MNSIKDISGKTEVSLFLQCIGTVEVYINFVIMIYRLLKRREELKWKTIIKL